MARRLTAVTSTHQYDAIIVGAGPNGLTAGARIAKSGGKVLVLEANNIIGGGARSFDSNGFVHDSCSTIHSLAAVAPAFGELGILDAAPADPSAGRRVDWAHFPVELAHPLPGRDAALLYRDIDRTAERMGDDAKRYRQLIGPLVEHWDDLAAELLGPIVHAPRHPITLARFGLPALLPATSGLRRFFSGDDARVLLGGGAAHSYVPLTSPLTMAFALMLQVGAHVGGWPVATGGSRTIPDALADIITTHGGSIETGERVTSMSQLPNAAAVLFDLTPSALVGIDGLDLGWRHRRAYRSFRHGAAAFKVDYELSGPMPWADPEVANAGTVHVVGSFDELVMAEAQVGAGDLPERPFVLVVQACVADPSRAPSGHHTLWTYAHVPAGFAGDARPQLEAQIERFAPGWRDLVTAAHITTPTDMETANANYVRGDIGGGSYGGLQSLARPLLSPFPYRTGHNGTYLCSASTPPGAGSHGMAGWNAAGDALSRELRHLGG